MAIVHNAAVNVGHESVMPNLGSLCTDAEEKYGDRDLEDKK